MKLRSHVQQRGNVMSDWISELGSRLVVGHKRDGRCVYNAQAKQELVLACRESGVSISKVARECGINANQLSAWIRRHERGSAKAVALVASAVQMTQPAFVSVAIEAPKQEAVVTVDLQARLASHRLRLRRSPMASDRTGLR